MWGLDGPKRLATQLLWDANAKVDDLLNEFYDDFLVMPHPQ